MVILTEMVMSRSEEFHFGESLIVSRSTLEKNLDLDLDSGKKLDLDLNLD